ncbi:MAG: amidohydrolase family protein [Anaerolineales bacterium]|nr:amidohydrolase family protein [Anaerolineales bacterium]
MDGQAPTAYTHEPHEGTSWDMPTWDPQVFKDTIRTLHDTGLQISVHCGGDAAVDLTLDAYEAALNANPRSDHRPRIEHAVITTKDATKRIKDLGVVIQSNPAFIRMSGDYYEQLLIKKQMERVIVDRELLDAGTPLAYGSDAPTTPWHKPQITIAAGMARNMSPTRRTSEARLRLENQAILLSGARTPPGQLPRTYLTCRICS